jgi:hypothetical protein
VFFFEQTFQTVLNGVSGAFGPMAAITNIANAILLLCALFAVYEAYARGGDARMIGIAAAKFLLLGLILSNYDSIFRSVNGAFNQVATAISPNDWANNWMLQVNQYFNGLGNASWFNLVVSSIVALISVLVQLIAAVVFPISLLIFTILYCLYGAAGTLFSACRGLCHVWRERDRAASVEIIKALRRRLTTTASVAALAGFTLAIATWLH